jgi:hypothetical protein
MKEEEQKLIEICLYVYVISCLLLMYAHIATTQNNFQQLLLVWYYEEEKTPHHHHHTDVIMIKAVRGNLGSLFLVCNLILTKLDEIWKTTYIFFKWKTI